MLSTLFKDIIDRYQNKISGEFSKDEFVAQIVNDIPDLLRENLKNSDAYKIKGSVGVGNWAETPWVALLDSQITNTTQQGYYVCYLINPKQRTMYLSLAVGWTQFADKYPVKEAKQKIAEYGRYLVAQLKGVPASYRSGPIDLSAEHSLSKGYEQGQILYRKYESEDLSDETLYADLEAMLDMYAQLRGLVGSDIQNIDYENIAAGGKIDEVGRLANQITLQDDLGQIDEILKGLSNSMPPGRVERVVRKLVRSRKIAELVKKRNRYICEICGREPFIQKNGKPYAEADHIRPLGGLASGLDTPENMRCLCAQCHAVVTHGSDDEVRKLIAAKSHS